VDARETWQALQARLTNARAAVEAGDRARALAEIAAALDIDPDFLAAHSLRDHILAAPAVPPSEPAAPSAPSGTALPPAPPDGYARFEQRAKRRRVDRRLDAARAALESGRLKAAATALEEVIELDPNLPELPQLAARYDDMRRRAAETHHGPRFVAGAVFVVSVLGASLLHDSTSLISRPMIAAAPLVATAPDSVPGSVAEVPPTVTLPDVTPVASTGSREPVAEPDVLPPVIVEPVNALSVDPPPAMRSPAEIPDSVAQPSPSVVPSPRLAGIVPENAPVAPVSMVMNPPAPLADDNQLIKQALQQYRAAYEGLDAQSAQAVWPAVNQAALARAFDGLESQSLNFDVCVVRVRDETATATCEGSARYIPKVGSREPRIEPRVWNFSLHKAGADWKIESARASR